MITFLLREDVHVLGDSGVIVWQPMFAIPLIVALLVVSVSVTVWSISRSWAGWHWRVPLLLLRTCVLILLAVLLLGPSRYPPPRFEQQWPLVDVVLDVSGSMLTKDCGDEAERMRLI